MNAESVNRGGIGGRRSRSAAAGIVVSVLLLTSACAAGRRAQTANQIPTQDGVNATVRNMALRGLAVYAPTGSPYYPAGSSVRMRLVLVNTGTSTDALTGLTSTSISGWGSYPGTAATRPISPTSPTSPISTTSTTSPRVATASSSPTAAIPTGAQTVVVGAGSRVSYGVPDSTRVLLLRGTKGRLYPGDSVRITFTFARAGDITVAVPIQLSDTPGTETVEPQVGASEGD